jgi:hypothetical protein
MLLNQGDAIDTNNALIKTFEVHIAEHDTTRSWDTDIVISQNEASFLPSNMKQGASNFLHGLSMSCVPCPG